MRKTLLAMAAVGCLSATTSYAAQWSNTEVHLQYGDLTSVIDGEEYSTTIITLQHASGWKFGDNFFFVDHSSANGGTEFYGEWYPGFSSNKILGIEYGGLLKDVSFVMGVNAAPDVDVLKYLPGINLSWNIDGFAFLNTMITSYIDSTKNDFFKEEDGFMFDVSWKYPFDIGNQSFDIQGHAEYISKRDYEERDGEAKAWILAQPQFRWNAGKTLFQEDNLFYLGIEYQYFKNKLGSEEKDNVAQFLAVWVL
ncbi:MAG: hypothetical protein MI867_00550 [Pseudomonadales bacterium]|nr:hypothetical protein [Pseudomonadales bacterium]